MWLPALHCTLRPAPVEARGEFLGDNPTCRGDCAEALVTILSLAVHCRCRSTVRPTAWFLSRIATSSTTRRARQSVPVELHLIASGSHISDTYPEFAEASVAWIDLLLDGDVVNPRTYLFSGLDPATRTSDRPHDSATTLPPVVPSSRRSDLGNSVRRSASSNLPRRG